MTDLRFVVLCKQQHTYLIRFDDSTESLFAASKQMAAWVCDMELDFTLEDAGMMSEMIGAVSTAEIKHG